MIQERFLFIASLIAAAVVVFVLAIVIWRKRTSVGTLANYLSICLVAVCIYSFGYAMEISNDSLPVIMFWVRFQHWGIHVIAPAWMLFSVCLAGKEKWITPGRVAALFVLPLVLLVASQTLGGANWFHANPRLNTGGPFPTFTYDRGLIVYLSIIYESLCLAASTVLFTIMLTRSAPVFRKRVAVFWLGSLLPWVSGMFYNLGMAPYNLDTTPFALTLSCMIFALGILRFQLLDIVPLARDVIFEGMSDGVMVLDNQDRIIDFNPRLQDILPDIGKMSIGKPVYDAVTAYPTFLQLLKNNLADTVEIEISRSFGISYYQGTLAPLYNWQKRKVGKVITLHDYTQVKLLLSQLEELAIMDSLTGIYNRRHFDQLAEQQIYRFHRYGKALALIMLDLDFFKQVNDTYSHAAGDLALKTVVDTCLGMLRQSDIFGRYGGEEFVILLPETDLSAAAVLAERLRAAIELLHIEYKDISFSVTASLGVTSAVLPEETSLEELYHLVDHAVYQAKKAGRNCVYVFDPSVKPASGSTN